MPKEPTAYLIGGNELLEQAKINHRLLAYRLHRDITHTYRIVNGATGLSMVVAVRLAQLVGSITVDMDGFVVEIRPTVKKQCNSTGQLSPAEAGWVFAKENSEAEAHMNEFLRALRTGDFQVMVHLFEQLVCDPRHANEMLEMAIARVLGERFQKVRDAAYQNHSRKIEARYSQVA